MPARKLTLLYRCQKCRETWLESDPQYRCINCRSTDIKGSAPYAVDPANPTDFRQQAMGVDLASEPDRTVVALIDPQEPYEFRWRGFRSADIPVRVSPYLPPGSAFLMNRDGQESVVTGNRATLAEMQRVFNETVNGMLEQAHPGRAGDRPTNPAREALLRPAEPPADSVRFDQKRKIGVE